MYILDLHPPPSNSSNYINVYRDSIPNYYVSCNIPGGLTGIFHRKNGGNLWDGTLAV